MRRTQGVCVLQGRHSISVNHSDLPSYCDRDPTFWNQDVSRPTFLSEGPGSFSLLFFICQGSHIPQPCSKISYFARCGDKNIPQQRSLKGEPALAQGSRTHAIITKRAWWQKLEEQVKLHLQ